MMRMRGIWILFLAMALPQVGVTQEVAWTVQTNRGWIGISFNYSSADLSGSEQTVVVIEGVAKGSPAEAAGIRAGDTLIHLDGQPISEEVMASLTRGLEVGDLVRMTILRGERRREVLVEAGPRGPTSWVMAPNTREMVVRLNSVRGAILKNLDSIRLSIAGVNLVDIDPSGGVSIRILKAPPKTGEMADQFSFTYRIREPFLDTLRITREFFAPAPDLALPFGAFVVGSEETSPLRDDLKRIRKELTEVRRSELSRMRELQAGIQGPVEEIARQDERIQELKALEEVLLREQRQATGELRQVSEEMMRRQFFEIQMRQEESQAAALRTREWISVRERADVRDAYRDRERALQELYESRRPLSHIIVGQSFVAGAQLTPLNPALAEYFQVDEGVLVTEVLDGTPASEAGILAGDVIVRVGTQDVSSLNDLRFGIGYFERPLRLRVIRKGSPMEIVIER